MLENQAINCRKSLNTFFFIKKDPFSMGSLGRKVFFSTLLKDPTHMHQCFLYLVQVNFFQKHYILASTNPQFDKRLFIELQVQYINENGKRRTCSEQFVYTSCSPHVLSLQFSCTELVNQ